MIFTDVRPGNYPIQVSKSGYTTDTGMVIAELEETAELTILLEKEARGIPGFPYECARAGAGPLHPRGLAVCLASVTEEVE